VDDLVIAGTPSGRGADVYPDIRGEHPVFSGGDEDIDVGPGQVEVVAAFPAVAVAVVIAVVIRAESDRDLGSEFLRFFFRVGQDIEQPS
jgi:hypothetical protein